MTASHSSPVDSSAAIRATFVTATPSPYTRDLFAAMSKDGRIAPRVFYLEQHAPAFKWSDPELPAYSEILPGGWFHFLGARIHANPSAVARVHRTRPEVVVVAGYSGLTNQGLMWWLKATRTPWVFYGEIPGYERRGRIGTMLRTVARWPAVRWSSGIAAVGSKAAAVYRGLAPTERPVENIPYYCDMTAFSRSHRSPTQTGALRLLYCGQLVHRKGVDVLLAAFLRLARHFPHVRLTLVGDGELADPLRQGVPADLRDRVTFTGFLQVDELPAKFADADVFILPSRHDGWGVVVNQALAAGLAVVSSDAVGAAADMVRPGENGMVVPAGDAEALFAALSQLAADPKLVERYGRRSNELAADWLPERGVERWYQLVRAVLSEGRGPRCR